MTHDIDTGRNPAPAETPARKAVRDVIEHLNAGHVFAPERKAIREAVDKAEVASTKGSIGHALGQRP